MRAGFTFSTLWGCAVAASIVAVAPVSAVAMRDPQVAPVLRVLAVGFAVGGTGVVAGALLRRRLDFRTQFFIDTASYVIGYGTIASTLAILGHGVWSLVWGGLAQLLLASGAQLAAVRHSIRAPARLRRGYLLMTEVTSMIAAPAMGLLAIGAPHLVRSLYGPRWVGAVAPLQVLCAAGYFRALYHLGGIVAQSVGRVYREMWRQAAYAVLVIAGALVGSRYGLGGVAIGVGVAILFMFFATAQLALRATDTSWAPTSASSAPDSSRPQRRVAPPL